MEQTANDRSIVLTRQTYYQIVHDLWRSLPPPVSDHPDDRTCRANAAMAEVASLLPADPAEAALACQFVAACAQAMDCLRLVNEHRAELVLAMRCRAQAASMMRQACMARSTLLRVQQERRAVAASGMAANEPAWSDHGILDRVAEAVKQAPKPVRAGAAVPATAEPAVSRRDDHPAAASTRTDAPAGDLSTAQTVSSVETGFKVCSNETLARLAGPAAPGEGLPGLPGPPHHPNDCPKAPLGLLAARFAVPKRDLLASTAVTAAMNRTPYPAGPVPRAA